MVGIIQKVKHVIVPSRELTYPTLGKGKSSTQNAIFWGDMLVPWRVCFPFAVSSFGGITKCLSFGGHWCFRNSCYYRTSSEVESSGNPETHQQFRSLILTKTSANKKHGTVRDCILGWWTKQLGKHGHYESLSSLFRKVGGEIRIYLWPSSSFRSTFFKGHLF